MNNHRTGPDEKILNLALLGATVILSMANVLVMTRKNMDPSHPLAGPLLGGVITVLFASGAPLILRGAFPKISHKKGLNYLSGLGALIPGLGIGGLLFFLMGFDFASPDINLVVFLATGMTYMGLSIWRGMETASLPVALLGGLMGGGGFLLTVSVFTGLFPDMADAPFHARYAYVLVGGYAGYIQASMARFSRVMVTATGKDDPGGSNRGDDTL